MPDDKLGVVAVTTKDAANAVTGRIADFALKAMLAAREGRTIPEPEITAPVDPAFATRVAGALREWLESGRSDRTRRNALDDQLGWRRAGAAALPRQRPRRR